MAIEYYYDCPRCGQSEGVCVIASHEYGDIMIDVQIPTDCGCTLTYNDEDDLVELTHYEYMDDLMSEAEAAADAYYEARMDDARDAE